MLACHNHSTGWDCLAGRWKHIFNMLLQSLSTVKILTKYTKYPRGIVNLCAVTSVCDKGASVLHVPLPQPHSVHYQAIKQLPSQWDTVGMRAHLHAQLPWHIFTGLLCLQYICVRKIQSYSKKWLARCQFVINVLSFYWQIVTASQFK